MSLSVHYFCKTNKEYKKNRGCNAFANRRELSQNPKSMLSKHERLTKSKWVTNSADSVSILLFLTQPQPFKKKLPNKASLSKPFEQQLDWLASFGWRKPRKTTMPLPEGWLCNRHFTTPSVMESFKHDIDPK